MLIFDNTPHGHRGNYVRVIAKILDGQGIIGPIRRHIFRLISAPFVVLPTFESAPKFYTIVGVLRALLGRRTTIITLRAHLRRRDRMIWELARKASYRLLARFAAIQILSITPLKDDGPLPLNFATEIDDIEFWDLPDSVLKAPPATDLSRKIIRSKNSKKLLMVIGSVSSIKGLEFLHDIVQSCPELCSKFVLACIGKIEDGAAAKIHRLMSFASIVENRHLTDEEIFSAYASADVVWCCYRPDNDLSSGTFGRAFQFGVPTIVRSGSLLAGYQGKLGGGVKLGYGDVGGACQILLAAEFARSEPSCRYTAKSEQLKKLIVAHKNGGD